MGRLVDIDAVRNAIQEEWGGVVGRYRALDIIDDTTHAVEQVETVEAIPVDWLESYVVLAEADGRPFFAEGIRDMVEEWRKEQKGN